MTTNALHSGSTLTIHTDLLDGESLTAYGKRTRPVKRPLLSRIFGRAA